VYPLARPGLNPSGSPALNRSRCHEVGQFLGERLQSAGYLALRNVSCKVHEGVVHLHGRVPSYYLKQVAQTVISDVEGIYGIVNHIEVDAPPRCPAFWRVPRAERALAVSLD
jgi:BON domain-containing protein